MQESDKVIKMIFQMMPDVAAFSAAFTIVTTSVSRCKKTVSLQLFAVAFLVEVVFVVSGMQMFSLLSVMATGAFLLYRQDKKLHDSIFSSLLAVILLTIGVTVAAIPLSAFLPQGGFYNCIMCFIVMMYALMCRMLIKRHLPRRVLQNPGMLAFMNAIGTVIVVFVSVIAPLFLLYSMETLPFYLMFIIFLIIAVTFSVYVIKAEAEKNRQEYNRLIDKQYEEVIVFRHYYSKLYRSLHHFVREKNMAGIERIFYRYIVPEHTDQIENGFDYGILTLVKLPLLNGLLYDTVMSLRQKEILLDLHIEGIIATENIKELDLFKILAHLIENAVQETEKQDNGHVSIFLSEDGKRTDIRIENTLESNIDISLVYEEGYTTKDYHAGSGLPEVRRIVGSYPNVLLSTYRQLGLFIQSITIE